MSKEIDAMDVITSALDSYGGRQKIAGDFRMIQCPFHSDNTPSLGVYVSRNGRRKLGWFNCLGCSEKGDWNKLAEKAGFQTIKNADLQEKTAARIICSNVEEKLLGSNTLTIAQMIRMKENTGAIEWPESIKWRGFSGKFIRSIGGYIVDDTFNNSVAALFPVYVHKKLRGWVKAVYEKRGRGPSYITMKGEWISKYGLFCFDIAKQIIDENKYDFVVLVEGPRDAMRLLKYGIPAIAILGAGTLTKQKAAIVKTLGVSCVYAMPDNDKAGSVMWKSIKALFDTCRRLKLPKEYDGNGSLIKVDPYSASKEILDEVVALLQKRHAFRHKNRA